MDVQPKIYTYFVSFQYITVTGSGFGNTQINMTAPIGTIADITAITKKIENDLSMSITIINYREF